MTESEAEKFCERRKAEIDRWMKQTPRDKPTSEDEGDYVAVAYWWGEDKSRRRIHKVGRTLVQAVEQCQRAESN